MKTKKRSSILFSRKESLVLKSLEQRWAPQFRVYPNLPLSAVLDVDTQTLDQREKAFFYKTSVDYTICKASCEPVLCIELDGIGDGYEASGVYTSSVEYLTDDAREKREWMLNFKLRVCNEGGLPLIIVNLNDVSKLRGEELSLLDIFVSDILITQRECELRNEGISEVIREHGEITEEELETIDIGAGIDAEREFDIVEHRLLEIVEQLHKHGVDVPFPVLFTGSHSSRGALRMQRFEYPPTPEYKGGGFMTLDHLKWMREVRLPAFSKIKRIGCVATYDRSATIKDIGGGCIWVTNGRDVDAARIAQKIAVLMLYKSILQSVNIT